MDPAERSALVQRGVEEVVTGEELESILSENADPRVYIGYAPTGEMHIGHFTTIRKLADFIAADLSVTVLIADLHAHLDDEKSPMELLDSRSEYYKVAIEAMIEAAGAETEAVTFRRGSEFELDQPYTLELFQLAAQTTSPRAQRAGSEVVRERTDPTVGGLLYPLMQALDVAALDADIAYGGIDQRGIYMLGREVLPDIGESKPICLFAPLLSGLSGGKMSASESDTAIRLTDDRAAIEDKINGAYCPAGETDGNGVLEYLEYLLFPIVADGDDSFVIDRPDEYGGTLRYSSYEVLERDFVDGSLHPADLKPAVAEAIDEVIDPVRKRLLDRPELLADAYPDRHE